MLFGVSSALLTVGGEEEVCSVLLGQPSDLVDLLLDLQALQVVELWLVALEGAVHVVLPPPLGLALALHRGGATVQRVWVLLPDAHYIMSQLHVAMALADARYAVGCCCCFMTLHHL